MADTEDADPRWPEDIRTGASPNTGTPARWVMGPTPIREGAAIEPRPGAFAITKARKLRMRLGGSGNLLEPFPGKPPRMHRRTYLRLQAAAMAAQERMLFLELDWLRTRHPGVTLGPL